MSARTGSGAGSSSSRRGSGVEKPWASGRILTPEQRARKQEADRKANRFLKKEVQDRLSLLETRVEGLENAKGEKIKIKTAPSSNGDTAGGGAGMEWSVPDRSVIQAQSQIGSDHSHFSATPTARTASQSEGYFASSNAETVPRHSPRAQSSGDVDPATTDSLEALRNAVTPDFTDVASIARTRSEGRHMTCFLNNLVNYLRTLPPAAVCFEDQYNQDLIVTAVLKGWDYTLSRYQQRCPLWDVLRLVDMYLCRDTNLLERVGCLRMLHKRYLFEVNANIPAAGPPPPWYRPQFCEKVFFHDPVIDHLTWPSLRDRLISSEKDRLTNKFWVLFMRNLRVTWRHEPIDMMAYSQQSQLYFLTPTFEAALLDINNWRMDMDFFRGIPQLAGDVPPYNYMPLTTHSPKFGQPPQQNQQNSAESNNVQVPSQTPVQAQVHAIPPQQPPTPARFSMRPDSTQQHPQQPGLPQQPQHPQHPQQVQQPQHPQQVQQPQHPQQVQQSQHPQQLQQPQHPHQVQQSQHPQHPHPMPDMGAQDTWLMRPTATFLDGPPHLDMSKFTPTTGTWHDFYG